MPLTNCSRCRYFDPNHSRHSNNVICAVTPHYASMWLKLKSLDEPTLNAIPVDLCHEFELNPSLEEKEISFYLTFHQWRSLTSQSHGNYSGEIKKAIDNSIKNKLFQHSFSLTRGDWQKIANNCQDSDVLHNLKEQGIEPTK